MDTSAIQPAEVLSLATPTLPLIVAAPVYYPGIGGVGVGAGYTRYELAIDTTGLPADVPLWDLAVEVLVAGAWLQDAKVTGAQAGPYKGGSMIWTTGGAFSFAGVTGARMRFYRCAGWVVPSVRLTVSG